MTSLRFIFLVIPSFLLMTLQGVNSQVVVANGDMTAVLSATDRTTFNDIVPSGWSAGVMVFSPWYMITTTPDTFASGVAPLGSSITFGESNNGGTFLHGLAIYNDSGTVIEESVAQTIGDFTIGETYTLIFEQSITNSVYSENNGFWSVSVGSMEFSSPSMDLPTLNTNAPWQEVEITFTAESVEMDFVFTAVAADQILADGRTDIALDGVRIILSPEPSSALLLLIGCAILGARRRKEK